MSLEPTSLQEIFNLATIPSQPSLSDFALVESGSYWRGVLLPNPQVHAAVMYQHGLRIFYLLTVKNDNPQCTQRDKAIASLVRALEYTNERYCIHVNQLYVERLINVAIMIDLVFKQSGIKLLIDESRNEINASVVDEIMHCGFEFKITRNSVVYVKCEYQFEWT